MNLVRLLPKLIGFLFLLMAVMACEEKKNSLKLNLDDDEDNLKAFLKMRVSLDENEETVYWWKGKVYSFLPQQRGKHLFDFEGFNIGRLKKEGENYQVLTKEASFYLDPKNGEILESWYNPLVKDTVDVIHVWNNPVNMSFKTGSYLFPYTQLGNDRICFNADILLAYPSPLSRAAFPKNSKSDTYQSAELFQFFVDKQALDQADKASAYAEISWTRVGDWLPWMEMGDQEGYLIYHCRGYKLENGFDDLPDYIKAYVAKNDERYGKAPTEFTKPNETSWTYFKKIQTVNQ
ncbi:MAG: DUF1838 family protein [Flammeovirgaceae bacterium]